jgi:hypothetical protein
LLLVLRGRNLNRLKEIHLVNNRRTPILNRNRTELGSRIVRGILTVPNAYIFGGYLRDTLAGESFRDIDVRWSEIGGAWVDRILPIK